MNPNPAALGTIRTIRTQIDPIVIQTPGEVTTDADPHDLIIKDRLDTVSTLPTDEPRRVATWGDTLEFLSQSSMRNALFSTLPLACAQIFASEQVDWFSRPSPSVLSIETLRNASTDELAELLKHSPVDPDEFSIERIIKTVTIVRHIVARMQHQIFLDSVYDTLPETLTTGVGKAFWQQPDPLLNRLSGGDPFTSDTQQTASPEQQTTLGEF